LRRFYDVGRNKKDSGQFNAHVAISGICSAAVLFKRAALEDIKEDTGYFDERFFFLVEDIDLSLRLRARAWEMLFCPDAVCYHYGNSSATSTSLRQYYSWRNRRMLLRKHRLGAFEAAIVFLLYDFPRMVCLWVANPHVRRELLLASAKYAKHAFKRTRDFP
jgi:GT2 family glycosyltransferase